MLADRAESVDVRVLSWAGSPLPLFHPDRAQGRELRDALRALRVTLDAMQTGPAIRTYNVMIGERRRVAAALIAVP